MDSRYVLFILSSHLELTRDQSYQFYDLIKEPLLNKISDILNTAASINIWYLCSKEQWLDLTEFCMRSPHLLGIISHITEDAASNREST